MNKKSNNKGFSLVELIVVIAIMAVLIGVLSPQLIRYVEKSREAKDITNLDTVVSAVLAYGVDRPAAEFVITGAKGGNFTATEGGTAIDLPTAAGVPTTAVSGDWSTAIKCTISTDGTRTYEGKAKYYEADGTKGFKAAGTSTSSSESSGS